MTFLIIGTIVLFKSMSLSYDNVIFACQKAFMGAFVAWIFGYMIGSVLEKSSPKKELESLSESIDDLLDDDEENAETKENIDIKKKD